MPSKIVLNTYATRIEIIQQRVAVLIRRGGLEDHLQDIEAVLKDVQDVILPLIEVTADLPSFSAVHEKAKDVAVEVARAAEYVRQIEIIKAPNEYPRPSPASVEKLRAMRDTLEKILFLDALLLVALTRQGQKTKYVQGEEVGRGGNSIVYRVQGMSNLVIKISNWKIGAYTRAAFEMHAELVRRTSALPDTVRCTRLLEVGFTDDDHMYIVQTLVSGSPVHVRNESQEEWSNRIEHLAQLPQQQYNRFIADVKAMHSMGLSVDPSKPDNFYLDEHGFSIVDPGLSDYIGSLIAPILHTYYYFTFSHSGHLTKRDVENVRTIVHKLELAGDYDSEARSKMVSQLADAALRVTDR